MLLIILRMLSVGSLAAFSASVSRVLGTGASGNRVQPARAGTADQPAAAAPRPAPFEPGLGPGPGLKLAPPGAAPGVRLPRGSLLDLSV